MTELSEEQRLMAELVEIQAKLDALHKQALSEAITSLQEDAIQINALIDQARRKAREAGVYFEYSSGYNSFGVYQWEQSDYC